MDPILQSCNFVFFIDVHFIFTISKRIFDGSSGFSGARFFQHCQIADKWISFPKIIFISRQELSTFLYFLKYLGVPQIKYNWLWESWSRPLGVNAIKMAGFRVFLKWNRKVISPEWSRIILRSFWANVFSKSYNKHGPPDPQTPNLHLF